MSVDKDGEFSEFLKWLYGYEEYIEVMQEYFKQIQHHRDNGVEIDDSTMTPECFSSEFIEWFGNIKESILKFQRLPENEAILQRIQESIDADYCTEFNSMMNEIERLIRENMRIRISIPGRTLHVFASVAQFRGKMPSDEVVALLETYVKKYIPGELIGPDFGSEEK